MNKVEETTKGFHDTDERYKKLIDDIKIDPEGRVLEVASEIVFLLMREDSYSQITSELRSGEIPLRVTHNDTKVNNVMMNKSTGDYLAVIDLDTVMPGSMLYDYGDGIRSTSSHSAEDEKDLTKVYIDDELFKSYTDGYMSEMAPFLTFEEVSLMGESIRIITLELAIEALQDYFTKPIMNKNKIDQVMQIVANYYNIKVEELKSKKRKNEIAFPRQVAMYICRNILDESLAKIGIEFGGKDHTTVMHSVNKISNLIKEDNKFELEINKLINQIK
jgi:hypothetical protein